MSSDASPSASTGDTAASTPWPENGDMWTPNIDLEGDGPQDAGFSWVFVNQGLKDCIIPQGQDSQVHCSGPCLDAPPQLMYVHMGPGQGMIEPHGLFTCPPVPAFYGGILPGAPAPVQGPFDGGAPAPVQGLFDSGAPAPVQGPFDSGPPVMFMSQRPELQDDSGGNPPPWPHNHGGGSSWSEDPVSGIDLTMLKQPLAGSPGTGSHDNAPAMQTPNLAFSPGAATGSNSTSSRVGTKRRRTKQSTSPLQPIPEDLQSSGRSSAAKGGFPPTKPPGSDAAWNPKETIALLHFLERAVEDENPWMTPDVHQVVLSDTLTFFKFSKKETTISEQNIAMKLQGITKNEVRRGEIRRCWERMVPWMSWERTVLARAFLVMADMSLDLIVNEGVSLVVTRMWNFDFQTTEEQHVQMAIRKFRSLLYDEGLRHALGNLLLRVACRWTRTMNKFSFFFRNRDECYEELEGLLRNTQAFLHYARLDIPAEEKVKAQMRAQMRKLKGSST